jgi:hypothetical protein
MLRDALFETQQTQFLHSLEVDSGATVSATKDGDGSL